MAIDIDTVRRAVAGITATLEAEHERLNQIDGQLGDGDIGITLLKGYRKLDEIGPQAPADLGRAFQAYAMAMNAVSSSSFGTLTSVAFLAVAKPLVGKTEIAGADVAPLLHAASEAMQKRGKASLGDKTVLDAMAAVETALAAAKPGDDLLAVARAATDRAIAEYREKPNRIGRARIFAEKTVGMDDPGMIAFKVMLDGLAAMPAKG